MRVCIIGAGASGINCALSLKKYHPEVDVFLIEKNEKMGKKIYASGNGRCNIGNLNVNENCYNNPEFMKKIIERFNINSYIKYLNGLGLFLKSDESGRLYPYSESSISVMNCFVRNLDKSGVKTIKNFEVTNVTYQNNNYHIISRENEMIECDYIVFSSGSNSYTNSNTIYNILKNFNIKITKLSCGLVGIKVKENIKKLKGIRAKAKCQLIVDDKVVFEEYGEVMFKEDGLSGIVIMNLSRHIVSNKTNYISLNLINEVSDSEIVEFIKTNKLLNRQEIYEGLFSKELAIYLSNQGKDILKVLKNLRFTYAGDYGFKNSQVTLGGVELNQIDENFKVIAMPNMYIVGELLDIDAECGGFNMYSFISSGVLLGKNMFTKEKN